MVCTKSPRFLCLYVSFYRCFSDIFRCADKIGAGPKRGHLGKLWDFFPQCARGRLLDNPHDFRNTKLRISADKQMGMITMTLHRKDFNLVGLTGLTCQFPKAFFNARNVKNFTPISRAENHMIIQKRYGCFGSFIYCIHAYSIPQHIQKCKHLFCIFTCVSKRFLPRLKPWAFSPYFCKHDEKNRRYCHLLWQHDGQGVFLAGGILARITDKTRFCERNRGKAV